jgi:FtsZ-interacting cell division protein YlmF
MAGFMGKIRDWFQDTMVAPGAKAPKRYQDEYSDDYDDDEYDTEDGYYEEEDSDDDSNHLVLHHTNRREEKKARRGSMRHPLDPEPVGQGNVVSFAAQKQFAETVIVHPKGVEDAIDIGNHVRSGKLCIVDLSSLEQKDSQRIADYLGGVCQGIDGVTVRVNHSIFTVCPPNHRVLTDYRDKEEEVGSAGIFRRMSGGL